MLLGAHTKVLYAFGMVQSRYARGTVELRKLAVPSRYARGTVEVRSWYGRGMLVLRSRYASGMVEVHSRKALGMLVMWSRYTHRCGSGTVWNFFSSCTVVI